MSVCILTEIICYNILMSSRDLVLLYRVENPTLPFNQPEGDYYKRELAGQWFDLHLDGALANLTSVWAFNRRCDAPAQLAIAQVLPDELESYHASNHPIASRMAHFNDDYIIPREGSVPVAEIDISGTNRGHMDKLARDAVKKYVECNLVNEGRMSSSFLDLLKNKIIRRA